jgi:cell division protein FtsZ
MQGSGEALMGMGEGVGSTRAIDAARRAINSPLLEDVSIDGAKGVLVNITGNRATSMVEVREAMNLIRESLSPEAHVFYGQVIDPNLDDKIKITVIATGLPPRRAVDEIKKTRTHEKFSDYSTPSSQDIDFSRPAYTYWRSKKLK